MTEKKPVPVRAVLIEPEKYIPAKYVQPEGKVSSEELELFLTVMAKTVFNLAAGFIGLRPKRKKRKRNHGRK